jgi:hypothetical protein
MQEKSGESLQYHRVKVPPLYKTRSLKVWSLKNGGYNTNPSFLKASTWKHVWGDIYTRMHT